MERRVGGCARPVKGEGAVRVVGVAADATAVLPQGAKRVAAFLAVAAGMADIGCTNAQHEGRRHVGHPPPRGGHHGTNALLAMSHARLP
jgi:hypothetical protein